MKGRGFFIFLYFGCVIVCYVCMRIRRLVGISRKMRGGGGERLEGVYTLRGYANLWVMDVNYNIQSSH